MSSKNSQCETFVPMLDAFVDNELDESEMEQVQMHLQSCDYCKQQVKEIETLKTSLASMPRTKMSLDLADNLDQILSKESGVPAQKPSNVVAISAKRRWIVAAASAAAVAVIAIAGSMVSKGGGGQVAISDSSGGLHSVAKNSSAAGQTAQKGMNTSDKNAFASNQLQSAHVADHNAADSQVAKSSDNNSHSGQKVTATHSDNRAVKEDLQDRAVAKTAGAHFSEDMGQNQSSNTTVVAHDGSSKTNIRGAQKDRSSGSELLALYEEDDGIGSDIGMTTDEDGLYAIKL
ncbi:MAG: hypothetical protein C0469_12005 [Cyanobacteria bacterium DS2.3.42]|nr:hypothetical protein [Cyanobacteria bacterium DS2.3.42]